jgi:predicted ATPase/DNA-binding winged helix-turn-helix (wHTH) protein
VQQATCYAFDNVELLAGERRLLIDGHPRTVGARAFRVLVTLLEHRDRVVTKDELLDAVWPNLVVEQNNVAVQIAALRKLLGASVVATVPGRGYKYSGGPVRTRTAAAAPAASPAPVRAASDLEVPLIGRSGDLRRLAELLSTHRAVALTGPGGIGKTRVAQRLLCDVAHRYPQGTVWIDLAPAGDEVTIVSTLARTLGIELRPDEPFESLLHALQQRQVLVIIDHVEVAPDEAARTVQVLMRRAPGLSFLLSGQMCLRLRDEQVVRLGGLPVPDTPLPARDALAFGSVSLYVVHAKAADPQFVLDEDNVAPVIELCRRLDGIPLAIGLAASRGGAREVSDTAVAVPRPRTLRQSLARSHDLLAERERKLLRRLSVFEEDAPLEMVLQVAAGEDGLDTWGVLDALTELVDRSLVIVIPGEPPRYRLLACTRHFATEQLELAGETADCLQRQARAAGTSPTGPEATAPKSRGSEPTRLQSA